MWNGKYYSIYFSKNIICYSLSSGHNSSHSSYVQNITPLHLKCSKAWHQSPSWNPESHHLNQIYGQIRLLGYYSSNTVYLNQRICELERQVICICTHPVNSGEIHYCSCILKNIKHIKRFFPQKCLTIFESKFSDLKNKSALFVVKACCIFLLGGRGRLQ